MYVGDSGVGALYFCWVACTRGVLETQKQAKSLEFYWDGCMLRCVTLFVTFLVQVIFIYHT